MKRSCLIVLFACTSVWAQFEIKGTVRDPNTHQPIQGVEITLLEGNGILAPGAQSEKVQTDSQGAFHFTVDKAGQWVVRSHKDGYTPIAGARMSDQGSVTFSDKKKEATFDFQLEQQAGIFGLVIDDESGQPIPNLRLGINRYLSQNGRSRARGSGTNTNAQGEFRKGAAAGRYLIEINPYMGLAQSTPDHIRTTFTQEDVGATDLGYRSAFYPGGPGIDTALPFAIASGGSASAGTIRIRKQPLYRVLVNIDPVSCPAGAKLSVFDTIVRFASGEITLVENVPCGPFLMTHMSPGNYLLDLLATVTGADGSKDTVFDTVFYTVAEQNLEIPVRLSHGTDLKGAFVAAEGAGEVPFQNFTISFSPRLVVRCRRKSSRTRWTKKGALCSPAHGMDGVGLRLPG